MYAYKRYLRAGLDVCNQTEKYNIVMHKSCSFSGIKIYDIFVNKHVLHGNLGIPGTRSYLFDKYVLIYSEDPELIDQQYKLFERCMGDHSLLLSYIKENNEMCERINKK
jgi:hypothetical protein